jgi:ABC-type transport system involved in cytochrome c biogenesis permease subunit
MYSFILRFLTSLRLTVICLFMAIVLVFAGTLAQVDIGLWEAQKQYFHSLMIFWTPKGFDLRIPVWPGGYLLGWVLVVNLLVTHIKRFQFSRKKIGILLTHMGVLILLVGQFLTESLQVESFMRLEEGETKSYSESARTTELAITDITEEDQTVTVIPDAALAKKREIRHPNLPFSVRVKEWHANSEPHLLSLSELPFSPRIPGSERKLSFKPAAITAKPNEANLPSTLVEIFDDAGIAGTFLLSSFCSNPHAAAWLKKWAQTTFNLDLTETLESPVQFTRNGRSYRLELRATRYYKFLTGGTQTYNLTLLTFHHDLYPGTQIPKNFSSLVRIRNPQTGENREALISMNNPLRYGGEAYYQGSFDPNNDRATILQVVRNPVWLSPYLGCVIIASGLLFHFLTQLFRFGSRTKAARIKRPVPATEGAPEPVWSEPKTNNWLPLMLPAGAALWLLASLIPDRHSDGFQSKEFGKLPVLLNGRIQPVDSMARNALLLMSGRSVVRDTTDNLKISASDWVLEAVFDSAEADKRKIFRLENLELRALFNAMEGRFGFVSFEEVRPKLNEIEGQAQQIATHKKDAQLRTGYERDLLHLYESLLLFQRIKNTFQPEGVTDFAEELQSFKQSLASGVAAYRLIERGEESDDDHLSQLARFFHRYDFLSRYAYALVVPPSVEENRVSDWKSVGTVLLESIRSGRTPEALTFVARLSSTYNCGDVSGFNKALIEYRAWLLKQGFTTQLKKANREAYFNHVQFFYNATVLYSVATILACAFWIKFSEPLRVAAVRILVLSFFFHTSGLIFRMALEGRPPVTNLYSSAVFVGWGSVLLGLILERIYRGGTGTVVAGLIGFVTLIIAHHLSLSSDTMQVLQAVLDTNVWLATHVVVVVSGYAAMLLAGVIAAIYIVRGIMSRSFSAQFDGVFSRMVFGILCFATLCSFTGTVLGGIWADQSWGRFWGWDPKENGALLIVLWCAVVLHARVGGLIKERGLMAMAIFGNIITSFSWFGVNLLGVGLHNYGFMEGAFKWLLIFILSQLLLVAAAFLPIRFWRVRPL